MSTSKDIEWNISDWKNTVIGVIEGTAKFVLRFEKYWQGEYLQEEY